MSDRSAIEWTDATWPIVQGCDPVSQGCAGCYAVPLLWRMQHNPDPKISRPLQGVTELHVNAAGERILRFTGKIALREDRLDWPLKWKQPRMIFVPSHGDLFHKDVPDEFIDRVFAVMALCPQHAFQVLTKRTERMWEYFTPGRLAAICDQVMHLLDRKLGDARGPAKLPLPNVWLGVSAERQEEADERIPHLLQTPAAVRFLSAEPLLGPLDLRSYLQESEGCGNCGDGSFYEHRRRCRDEPISVTTPGLDWVIVGGESGPKARPMHPDWARSIRGQCKTAGAAFFFKQWGEWLPGTQYEQVHRDLDPDLEQSRFACMDWDGERYVDSGGAWCDDLDEHAVFRVGKKAAGRLLDGELHDDFPRPEGASP